jgi:hypothetical protein
MGAGLGHFGWSVCSVTPFCHGFEMLSLACESGLHAEFAN